MSLQVGRCFLGASLFLVAISGLVSVKSLVQVWTLGLSTKHSLQVSNLYFAGLFVSFVAASWSIGYAFAHVAGLLLAKITIKSAPD